MKITDVKWNKEARQKIIDDANNVLREAVLDIARSNDSITSDEAFAQLTGRLKDQFIDWEPGPDLRTYADAIADGEIDLDD